MSRLREAKMETKTGSGKGKNMRRSLDIGKSHGIGARKGGQLLLKQKRQMRGVWVAELFGSNS